MRVRGQGRVNGTNALSPKQARVRAADAPNQKKTEIWPQIQQREVTGDPNARCRGERGRSASLTGGGRRKSRTRRCGRREVRSEGAGGKSRRAGRSRRYTARRRIATPPWKGRRTVKPHGVTATETDNSNALFLENVFCKWI